MVSLGYVQATIMRLRDKRVGNRPHLLFLLDCKLNLFRRIGRPVLLVGAFDQIACHCLQRIGPVTIYFKLNKGFCDQPLRIF